MVFLTPDFFNDLLEFLFTLEAFLKKIISLGYVLIRLALSQFCLSSLHYIGALCPAVRASRLWEPIGILE